MGCTRFKGRVTEGNAKQGPPRIPRPGSLLSKRKQALPPKPLNTSWDFITIKRGDILPTTALEVEDGRVVAAYVVRNPDKLRHMADTLN